MIKNLYLGVLVGSGLAVVTVVALPLIVYVMCKPDFWTKRVEMNW